MSALPIEILATCLFGVAILHTFLANSIERVGHRFPKGSVGENFFHLMGEVEVVFGVWASLFVVGMAIIAGRYDAVDYLNGVYVLPGTTAPIRVDFTEPMFVFVIMAMSATRPVLQFTASIIDTAARVLPLPNGLAFYVACLIIGPLLGSFITEPAAMTVTALLLKRRFYDRGVSRKLMYATMGVLFVNVSIGGTLTHFAAPPVLMVAETWGWDVAFMLGHFGWKAAVAVVLNTMVVAWLFRREVAGLSDRAIDMPVDVGAQRSRAPVWLIVVHLVLMAAVVFFNHDLAVFFIIFLFFLGMAEVTSEHQDEMKLKESLLVGYFLMGLVILGGLQRWWLEPTITSMSDLPLFFGATGLTAITDNAALTYLGSQVPNLGFGAEYALVAGAVAGGGLTVIANAPNPAGYGILKPSFGKEGINPLMLLRSALVPTLIAMACLWFLPHVGSGPPDKPAASQDPPAEHQPAAHGRGH